MAQAPEGGGPSSTGERASRWRWIVGGICGLIGIAVGLGLFTFVYAEGGSYVTNDPAACANCHVMQSHYDAWIKSSHHAVTACNDCHAPHDAIFGKLWVKAVNGYNHSLAFTTGSFPDNMHITESNREVTEAACRYCHQDMVHAIDTGNSGQPQPCIRCHADVGHPR